MNLRCRICDSPSLRVSRLRVIDIPFLLVLYRAVRCTECYRRQYIPLPAAASLTGAKKKGPASRA